MLAEFPPSSDTGPGRGSTCGGAVERQEQLLGPGLPAQLRTPPAPRREGEGVVQERGRLPTMDVEGK